MPKGKFMGNKEKDKLLEKLPVCAQEYITLVIKKMRYRRKVRADVMSELATHFEDELRNCKTDEEKEKKAQRLIENFGDPKLLAILMRRAKKRCRPLWRTVIARTFQTAGVLILCLIFYTAWFFSGKPRITINYVDQLNRMVRPTADESLNAAPLYNKAAELYQKTTDNIGMLLGKRSNDVNSEQKQTIEKWLADNNEILDLVVAGSKKPYYWQTYQSKDKELRSILFPNLAGFRKLAYSLRWRAQLNAEKSRYQDAFDDIKTSYRIGWHLKTSGGTFIEQLMGMALKAVSVGTFRDILSRYQIDSAVLAATQKDFEQIVADENFIISLKGEKLFFYDEIQRCFTDDPIGGGHLYLKRIAELGEIGEPNYPNLRFFEILLTKGPLQILFTHPNKQQTVEMYDRYYNFWENIARKTPAQLKTEEINVDEQALKIVKGNILLETLAPAISKVFEIGYRNKVDVESTLPLIAILRYKQDFGDYPENLDKLIETGYLKSLPIDPFSDKPIVYKKTKDNFTLYSVGSNFVDDGGQPGRDKKGNIQRYMDNGDWIFWPVQQN